MNPINGGAVEVNLPGVPGQMIIHSMIDNFSHNSSEARRNMKRREKPRLLPRDDNSPLLLLKCRDVGGNSLRPVCEYLALTARSERD